MLPSLDNFVSFGAEVIKSRPAYKEMLIDIYTTSLSSNHLGENDRVEGCKLAESVLLNLRGHVDEALQVITVASLNHLDKTSTAAFRLANLEVLINAILYNPAATMHIMENHSPGAARNFFDKWFAAISGGNSALPRVHDKKLSIMALCALLEMDPAGVPKNLQDGWHGIVDGVLKIFKDLPSAIESSLQLVVSFYDSCFDVMPLRASVN
jgi:importin-7